ncbi:GntR family transcriptional regulator [Aureimonas sp. SA4125]|uniref:GntR family transcriptional regulator n=1 Tax=Aureimonas sp. SA4125 TaxID=2826993 RepID=UPI001CC5AB67|nr:GntR family transcriptional regulator [Aureimonas sp. SA4125]BDA87116.1 GntR family transcriptional regulator [Aureimonas sp. SA4125]
MSDFQPIDRSSLYEGVYARLALALTEGALKPDDKLRIRTLSDQFGVSVTPVRDAILRLVEAHALEWRGPKDIRVPRMTARQLDEVRLIRLRLEGLAARLAAQNIDRPGLLALAGVVADNERARSAGNIAAAVRLNREFHFSICEAAGLPVLRGMIQSLWLRMGPLIASVYELGGEAMIRHHYDILRAIEEGDGDAADTAIQADINDAVKFFELAGILGNGP